jgi:hypothetical protein
MLVDKRRDGQHSVSKKRAAKNLAKQLRSVGPRLAAKLVEAGIDSREKLIQMGAKEAFEKMYPGGDSYGDFNAAYL